MNEVTEELPWHAENWQRLQAAREGGRLPHALLITGAEGLGKHRFGIRLAASLLCQSPLEGGKPCGNCKNCHLFQAETHPDYRRIEPEEPGKAIKVDAIREFTAKETLTSQAGGFKVTIIEPADALNIAAANSLLKTLEEPVDWTIMILISSRPGRLPATIRSRCQRYHFATPEQAQSIEWLSQQGVATSPELLLALTSGSPLTALASADSELLAERERMLDEFSAILAKGSDPVAVASRWEKLPFARTLHWFCGWIVDMIRLRSVGEAIDVINPDQRKRFHSLAQEMDLKGLYDLLDRTYEAIRLSGSQLNTQMLLEGLLMTASRRDS
ncbi:MAG: DNA polymerase III subunit delta' [Candidatus Sedimenticola sp. (ex Thyasira tokunagai)]